MNFVEDVKILNFDGSCFVVTPSTGSNAKFSIGLDQLLNFPHQSIVKLNLETNGGINRNSETRTLLKRSKHYVLTDRIRLWRHLPAPNRVTKYSTFVSGIQSPSGAIRSMENTKLLINSPNS